MLVYGEGNGKGIGDVGGEAVETSLNVFLGLEPDGVLGVDLVEGGAEFLGELRVGREATGGDPVPERTPNLRSLVGVFGLGTVGRGEVDRGLGAELDFYDLDVELAETVDDTATYTTAVNGDELGVVLEHHAHNGVSYCHCVGAVELDVGKGTSVATSPWVEDGRVLAVAGYIDADDNGLVGIVRSLACLGLHDKATGDEGVEALGRELAENTDADEVGVEAFLVDLTIELVLVRERDGAGVDPATDPGVELGGLVNVVEMPRGHGWVAWGEPDDLSIGVGKGAGCNVPDDLGDFRGLVEDDKDALALVVKALEGGGVVLGPWDHVDAPGEELVAIIREERGRGEAEEVSSDIHVVPLAEFSPGLGPELALGVGGYDAASVLFEHGPEDKHGDHGGLADAVAAADGDTDDSVIDVDDPVSDEFKDFHLPDFGSGDIGKGSAGFAPREGVHDETDRIVLELEQVRKKRLMRVGLLEVRGPVDGIAEVLDIGLLCGGELDGVVFTHDR